MIIGSKIRTLRTVKGFSQENMAEMLGMSLNAYAKIEREETNVQVNRLEQIAEVLKTNLVDLLTFGENGAVYVNGNGSNNNGNNGTIYNANKEETDLMIELTRLRTENEGFKKEVGHLTEIITLLKN